jgi:hypothetical protein
MRLKEQALTLGILSKGTEKKYNEMGIFNLQTKYALHMKQGK